MFKATYQHLSSGFHLFSKKRILNSLPIPKLNSINKYQNSPLLTKLIYLLPDRLYFALRHWISIKRWPNFSNPTYFNEHILSLILTRENDTLRRLVCDKVEVRDHVEKLIGSKYLSKVHAIWDGNGPLPLERLPERFVAKPNHASGEVQIVWNKSELDEAELLSICKGWLDLDYGKASREYVYADVPRRVMFEELHLDPKTNRVPVDLKFYVFHGVPRVIKIHHDRFGNLTETYFDRNWTYLPGRRDSTAIGPCVPPPENLALLLELASKLSEGFDFIRVDLYDLGDRIVFGELTNFPGGGNQYQTEEFDAFLGQFMNSKIDASTDVPFVP